VPPVAPTRPADPTRALSRSVDDPAPVAETPGGTALGPDPSFEIRGVEVVEPNVEALLGASPAESASAALRVYPRIDERLLADLRSAGYRRIALQVPAGLVRNAHDLAARLSKDVGTEVVVTTRACFGGCDFPTPDEIPLAEASVVLGHAPIPNVSLPLPTYFVEMRHEGGDPEKMAMLVDRAGLPRRLGLVASIQHLDLVPRLADALVRTGRIARWGAGDRRLAYAAQALGCNYTGAEPLASEVDAFLFIGTGTFHPIGLAFAVDRPVYALDPLQGVLDPPLDRAALIRRRQLAVSAVRDAQRWGILVSSFPGQLRGGMAQALKARAVAHGRSAEILVSARLDPRDLEGRDLEAYVSTACPRIALDDSALYPKPLLTPPEFLMALGELPLEPYRFDTYH
jgi:2-(3-amino-3-carboxypropyl)histidine synthase